MKVIEDLQDKLKKCRLLNKLVPVTSAKVPILKFNHMQSKLEGDISIYNTLGQQNTKLLRTYSKIDRRVKVYTQYDHSLKVTYIFRMSLLLWRSLRFERLLMAHTHLILSRTSSC